MLPYFVYFEKKEVRVGYGTEQVARFICNRGAVLGEKRFATRNEAEAELISWETRIPLGARPNQQTRTRGTAEDNAL